MPDTRQVSSQPVRNRIGDAGLNEFSNSLDHTVEYLAELQGREGSTRYRQMSKGDPIIGMILRVHKNPIRSATWNIPYPADASDEEKFVIDMIKNHLFGESGTEFDVLLGKIMSMLEYGFSAFEQYYHPEEIDGNMYLMPMIEQRMQTSIERIRIDERIVDQITIKKGLAQIPFENMVFFVLNQQGDDMRGESLLRNAHRAWKAKKTYQEWLGIGIQRSVSGIPSMTVPKGITADNPNYINSELLLKNICQHENAYMIIEEGYTFTVHESKFNADPVQKAIDGCNTEMALSVLSQFVMLGQMGNTGAFALSRDQSDFFLDGLQYIVDLIAGGLNAYVIRPWLKINFGDAIDPGRVILSGQNLNKKAGIELSQVLQNLKNAGFIRPTVNDEIQLRSNLDMPELTEDEIEAHKTAPEPAPVATPFKFSEKSGNKDRRTFIENAEKEMADFMSANLLLIKDKFLADIESTLNRGTVEIQGLKNIEISASKYLKGLQMKLSGIAQDSWNRAKKMSRNKIKLAEIDPKEIADKTLKAFVLNQAQVITDKQIAMLKNRAILTASNNSLKGLSVAQTISNTSKAIDDYIESSGVQVDGTLMVVGTSNFGEQQFYKEIEDELWGYEFVGIDDDVQSEICAFYSGKTFSVNSPELAQATPPLHPNCRSYLQPIYKSEEKPEIDDVIAPPSIMKTKTFF